MVILNLETGKGFWTRDIEAGLRVANDTRTSARWNNPGYGGGEEVNGLGLIKFAASQDYSRYA